MKRSQQKFNELIYSQWAPSKPRMKMCAPKLAQNNMFIYFRFKKFVFYKPEEAVFENLFLLLYATIYVQITETKN